MGRMKGRRWNTLLVWFITSVGSLCYTITCIRAAEDPKIYANGHEKFYTVGPIPSPENDGNAVKEPVFCKAKTFVPSVKEKFLLFVSTLDGRLSALDIRNKGTLAWSVNADSRPLLSSSISKLEMTRNGMPTRLIPSLDGGLYQYDGQNIEAVPMTVDSLLSSTHRVSDKVMMVGAKDLKTYGINPLDGEMRYVCSYDGCQFFGDTDVTDEDDILVVTRKTNCVRALNSKTGIENWNFSVGQHELEFLAGNRVIPTQSVTREIEDDDVSITTCNINGEEEESDESLDIHNTLKIVVPEGMVIGLDPNNYDAIRWQHKFDSPVASAWILHKGELKPISVFNKMHIPALGIHPEEGEQAPPDPLLYVGLHKNQLYVQPSVQMKDKIKQASKTGFRPADVPRVTWKPYLNTADSRTPIFRGNSRKRIAMVDSCSAERNKYLEDENEQTGLTVWQENYPFDNGYYLYPDYGVELPSNHCETEGPDEPEYTIDMLPMSLWNYWKEIVAISVVSSVVVHVLLTRFGRYRHIDQQNSQSGGSDGSVSNSEKNEATVAPDKKPEEYVSRYNQDFEHVQVLGKGGYGIVFEAKNKMDECNYAVKRIALKNSEKAKEKMRREVRALAKLEHIGIVRYFQAWPELPPPGWQEMKDQILEDSECISMPTPCNSVTNMVSSSVAVSIPNTPVYDLQNPFGGGLSSYTETTRDFHRGGSKEFSVQNSITSDDTMSGSVNLLDDVDDDTSFGIEFKPQDSEDSGSCSNDIPFSRFSENQRKDVYSRQLKHSNDTDNKSFSIVFEDSGCGDNEKSNKSEISNSIVFEEGKTNSGNFRMDIPNTDSKSTNQVQFSKYGSDVTYTHEYSTDVRDKAAANHSQKLYIFIQMQLCRKETLKDWLSANNQPREHSVIVDIFGQILSAVEYVHDSGLMHRDLKPSNIFFSIEGVIKIGDFGLVTDFTEEEMEGTAISVGNKSTRHTTEVGTKLYMGPELVSGKPYGHKVDIFSLGMILFELLYPFSTQMERVHTLTDVKCRKFPKSFEEKNSRECSYVKWLLSHDPADRPTATEILHSDLMKDYQNQHSRNRSRQRSRTISSSSGGSVGQSPVILKTEAVLDADL